MNLAQLRSADDYGSLSALFEIPASTLKAALYNKKFDGHTIFPIPKKSGGVRLIASPSRIRKELQRKLLPVIDEAYKAHPCAHGFVRKRSVCSNAAPHIKKRTIINVDLRDFFPTITFKRVRGIFLGKPFLLSWTSSNILAQLCCYQGALSTGGITSPAISNIACSRLDKRLAALASRLGGHYSRYADDITLSFDRPVAQLSSILLLDESGKVEPGAALSEVISTEGFSINLEKLRVASGASRKVVTGLVVNQRVNLRRDWLRSLESKIYAIEKFGLAKVASDDFPEIANPDVASSMLLRRIHGKVSYARMVRGNGDWVAARLAERFNNFSENDRLRVPSVEVVSVRERLARAVLIVNCANHPLPIFDAGESQGTAFVSRSGLLVTAAHVVVAEGTMIAFPHVYVMTERDRKLISCEVLYFDSQRDVAFLKPQHTDLELERCRLSTGHDPDNGDSLTSVGYPNYALNDKAAFQRCDVVRKLADNRIAKADISGAVQGGLSGGPLVDTRLHVRGIVHKGVGAAGGVAQMVLISEVVRAAVNAGLKL